MTKDVIRSCDSCRYRVNTKQDEHCTSNKLINWEAKKPKGETMTQDTLMTAPEPQNLFDLVRDWGKSKGIQQNASAKDQFCKTVEEVGEISECLSKGYDNNALKHEIGGAIVTLILLADIKGLDAEHCLMDEYLKISKRNGKMIDGVFVKEGD